ncbi:hypothetical protein V8F20_005957 [Naviculisporaceae sp. PSN 640]
MLKFKVWTVTEFRGTKNFLISETSHLVASSPAHPTIAVPLHRIQAGETSKPTLVSESLSSLPDSLLKMHIVEVILLLLSASVHALAVAIAAPSNAAANSNRNITGTHVPLQRPRIPPWTVAEYTRSCDVVCTVSFWIDTNDEEDISQFCTYTTPTAHSPITKFPCGHWTITSTWSPRLGQDRGFTTLTLLDTLDGLISWTRFFDSEITDGIAAEDRYVVPDWY